MKLNQKRLKELIHYNPETGDFKWIVKKAYRIKEGEIIKGTDTNGYLRVMIDRKRYPLHRLAFLYMEGYLPENEVDHINKIKTDNSWINLRETSHQCNIRNSTGDRKNKTKSGVRGVYWFERDKKWVARIHISYKMYHLGLFDDFDEAVAHRLAIEQCLDWDGCDSRSPAYLHIKNLQPPLNKHLVEY